MNGLVILGEKDELTCCVYLYTIYNSCVIIFNSFIFVFVQHYILIDFCLIFVAAQNFHNYIDSVVTA